MRLRVRGIVGEGGPGDVRGFSEVWGSEGQGRAQWGVREMVRGQGLGCNGDNSV